MPVSAERLDSTPLRIGKHRGKTPLEVSEVDPDYLVWAYDTWVPKPCSRLLYEACSVDDYDPPDSEFDCAD